MCSFISIHIIEIFVAVKECCELTNVFLILFFFSFTTLTEGKHYLFLRQHYFIGKPFDISK